MKLILRCLSSVPFSLALISCDSPTEGTKTPLEANEEESSVIDDQAGPALQVLPGQGGNPSGITPMDVANPPSSSSQAPASSSSPAEESPEEQLRALLGNNPNIEIRKIRTGVAAPGEGPVGPDGQVIDPQSIGPKAPPYPPLPPSGGATGPSPAPGNPGDEAVAAPIVIEPNRKLDPSEAPTLPLRANPDQDSE